MKGIHFKNHKQQKQLLLASTALGVHVKWAQTEKKHLLVDNLDAQRPGRADDALDHRFQRRVSHFEALVLGFDLGDLVHGPDRHHPRRLVAFCTQKRRTMRTKQGRHARPIQARCAGGTENQRLKRGWTLLRVPKVEIWNSLSSEKTLSCCCSSLASWI